MLLCTLELITDKKKKKKKKQFNLDKLQNEKLEPVSLPAVDLYEKEVEEI